MGLTCSLIVNVQIVKQRGVSINIDIDIIVDLTPGSAMVALRVVVVLSLIPRRSLDGIHRRAPGRMEARAEKAGGV